MKVLVVGSGGREHALCTAIKNSPLCDQLFCTPGNAGIAAIAQCWSFPADAVSGITEACQKNHIDFVVIGPETSLAAGLADELRAVMIPCFGPSQAAAALESSKGFMKDLCARANIPTATYKRFADANAARSYILTQGAPIVVKVDGLAAGKGVTVARTLGEALSAVDDAMETKIFGGAGAEIVIEEYMEGEEVSFFALTDGNTSRFFATAQDHKAALEGDKGPNTGGMGAYSPAPTVDHAMQQEIMTTIIHPTVAALNKIGCSFNGVLFAGLMLTKTGIRLIEFNARFGDPETEVMLPRLKSDLLSLLHACATGQLESVPLEWLDKAAVGVVMATKGYPGAYQNGSVIEGIQRASALPGTIVFHAGTRKDAAGHITANGGRVLCVTGLGDSIAEAQSRAYQAVDCIEWSDGFCRRDIGWRAVKNHEVA